MQGDMVQGDMVQGDLIGMREGYEASLAAAVGDTFADLGVVQEIFEDGYRERPFHLFAIVTSVDEEVSVPAGTFRGIRAEWRSIDTNGIPIRPRRSWDGWVVYAPGIGKIMEVEYDYDDDGTRIIRRFRQLSSVDLK